MLYGYEYSFIVHEITDDIYKESAEDAEKRFDMSNYRLKKPKGINKKFIRVLKDE